MQANTLKLYVTLLQHHLFCSVPFGLSLFSTFIASNVNIQNTLCEAHHREERETLLLFVVVVIFFFYIFRWFYITRPNYCSRILLVVVVVVIITRSNKMGEGKGKRERERERRYHVVKTMQNA